MIDVEKLRAQIRETTTIRKDEITKVQIDRSKIPSYLRNARYCIECKSQFLSACTTQKVSRCYKFFCFVLFCTFFTMTLIKYAFALDNMEEDEDDENGYYNSATKVYYSTKYQERGYWDEEEQSWTTQDGKGYWNEEEEIYKWYDFNYKLSYTYDYTDSEGKQVYNFYYKDNCIPGDMGGNLFYYYDHATQNKYRRNKCDEKVKDLVPK